MDQSGSTHASESFDDSIEANLQLLSPNLRGWVNDHYVSAMIEGKKMRICNIDRCGKKFSASSSHLSLRKHWKIAHNEQPNLKATRFLFSEELHTNRLIKLVIDAKLNFTIVERPSFLLFVESLNPHKKIICRRTLSNMITSRLQSLALQVTEKISEIDAIALTFDIWSPRKGARGFGCITAHYIERDGTPRNLILNFRRLKHPHDGDSICAYLQKTIVAHKLEGRIVAITTDNASVNITAIRKLVNSVELSPLSHGFVHYKCVAHIIDLGVRVAIKKLKNMIESVRQAILGVRSSGKRREMFIAIQERLIGDLDQSTDRPLELIEDIDHRWSSSLLMLERAYTLRTALDELLNTDPKLVSIGDIDWPTIEHLITFLKPFHDATKRVCVEENCSISSVSFVTPRLIEHCLKHENSSNDVIKDAARSLGSKLNEYRSDIYHPLVNIAHILDPRYKTKGIEENECLFLKSEIQSMLDCTTERDVGSASASQTATIFCDDSDTELESVDELDLYLKSRRESQNTNAYLYWKLASSQMPKLASIARKILCIQATSVASERVFSIAGNVDTVSRNRLTDDSVESIMLAKSWMVFLGVE